MSKSMSSVVILALLACSAFGLVTPKAKKSLLHATSEFSHLQSLPMATYKKECGLKRPVSKNAGFHSLVQHSRTNATNPGDGTGEFTPYDAVLKDGYTLMDCVVDEMFLNGDKFGPNKHDYNMKMTDVSIVHYTAHVVKEDRELMSPKICFQFCRTVPDMLFFGLINGRDCYCAPYYNMMASDSSQCDLPCEGDTALMCGGKKKSSIFEMHFCDSTKDDTDTAVEKALNLKEDMAGKAGDATKIAEAMNAAGEKLQPIFGKVGDSAAGDLMQAAKVYAGEVTHTAEQGEKIAKNLDDLASEAKGLSDFTDPAVVSKAENLMEKLEDTIADGVVFTKTLESTLATVQPGPVAEGAAKQYYPIMKFTDKGYLDVPQTCTGEMVNKPIGGLNVDGCASACDAETHTCKAFSFFASSDADATLCFLFSKFESATYYTDCKASADKKAVCMAKLSEFEGQDLSPKGDGKCKFCLKKLTKADRCYY